MSNRVLFELKKQAIKDNFGELHRAIQNLEWDQALAIHFRFWENLTISEIASILKMDWDEADQLIEKAVDNLRMDLEQSKNIQSENIAA